MEQIVTNKYQTKITEELLDSLHPEVRDQFLDIINNVSFIKNLISPDRKYAKDLPKDSEGKIIVDVCTPHILENMNYFRESAIHYLTHGCYTFLKPNGNPNSEFGKWITREKNRIWYGMIRESDGEWITGEMYFYLNYMPMELVEESIIRGKKIVNRKTSFPRCWEGIYLWFHYLYQSRYGGLYDNAGGKYGIQIATRGASKSFSCASMLARLFVCGDNENAKSRINAVIMAAMKDTLTKQGTLNKFEACIDHLADNTQFPRRRLLSSIDKMNWDMGYLDSETNIKKGTRNTVNGVSIADNADKGRGQRCTLMVFEEIGAFPKFLDVWSTNEPSVSSGGVTWGNLVGIGCVCKGTKVYDKLGKSINIEDITQESGIVGFKGISANIEPITYIQDECHKKCIRIETSLGILECSYDHPILVKHKTKHRYGDRKLDKATYTYETIWKEAGKLSKSLDRIIYCDKIDVWGTQEMKDPYIVGALIGDGSYGIDKTPVLSNCDIEVLEYFKSNYECVVERSHITKQEKIYEEIRVKNITKLLRSLNIYGQTKTNKRLPDNIDNYDKASILNLLAGLYDTDGCVYIKKSYLESCITLTQSSKEILLQIKDLLLKLGIRTTIQKTNPKISDSRKDKNPWYTLLIKDNQSKFNFCTQVPLKIEYKKEKMQVILDSMNQSKKFQNYYQNVRLSKINSIEDIGVQRIYNLTANDSHTYIANGIVTHNTGGSEGSSFEGIKEMLYNPRGYNVYALPNVFDKNAQGKSSSIFFFGAYLNREGYYNHDGVSDVVGAILMHLKIRHRVKYNSTDANRITRVIAENPLTIQEAIMVREGSIFPVAALTERLAELDLHISEYDDVYSGSLALNKQGKVEYKSTSDTPIREFPHKDNKLKGAIEIFKMPEKNSENEVFNNRYVGGIDTYDNDQADSVSLGSIFIMDLWTDSIVAEYTGRPDYADDFYEICRLLGLFYNARLNYENNKKGLYGYFSRMNCTYLLTDTLQFLKDKDMFKGQTFGNSSKGTVATPSVNNYARMLIRDYLLKPETALITENGEEKEITKYKLSSIRNRALIRELILWNRDGNFDRVSSLGMLMLLREDKIIMYQGNVTKNKEEVSSDYLGNDDFFTSNYDQRFQED